MKTIVDVHHLGLLIIIMVCFKDFVSFVTINKVYFVYELFEAYYSKLISLT